MLHQAHFDRKGGLQTFAAGTKLANEFPKPAILWGEFQTGSHKVGSANGLCGRAANGRVGGRSTTAFL
jgi:hypothetical protein